MGLRSVGKPHREKEDRLQKGEGDRGGKAEGELLQVAADESPDEAHGEQHGEQREGGRDDGAEDLACALEHGLLEAESHGAVPLHVLRDDDRVVHHDSDGDDQCQQGHEIEGEPGEPVQDGRGGQGDGNCRE